MCFGCSKSLPVAFRGISAVSSVWGLHNSVPNSKYVHLETSDEAQSRIEAGAVGSYCEISWDTGKLNIQVKNIGLEGAYCKWGEQ